MRHVTTPFCGYGVNQVRTLQHRPPFLLVPPHGIIQSAYLLQLLQLRCRVPERIIINAPRTDSLASSMLPVPAELLLSATTIFLLLIRIRSPQKSLSKLL